MGRVCFRIFLLGILLLRPAGAFADGSPASPSAAQLLADGIAAEEARDLSTALRTYRQLARRHPLDPEAPAALQRRGLIFLSQRRFQRAFHCFQHILDRYPDYPHYLEVIGLEFQTAERLMRGQRSYFFGRIPGFRDRAAAIEFFRKIVERAPYSDFAPGALLNIARLGIRTGEMEIAIEALEKLIDEYAASDLAPDALLLLAKVYRDRVVGPNYDQRAVREALNCYQEFLVLFPDSPRAEEAETGLAEAMELRAAGKLGMGNFYYDDRQNPAGALVYYNEVLEIAPESRAAERARERIAEIRAGRPGRGSPLDWLLGPYRPATENAPVKPDGREEVAEAPRLGIAISN
jgi:outer membrane protein assembly factor BamD